MVFQCINIRQVPWDVLKTAAFRLVFNVKGKITTTEVCAHRSLELTKTKKAQLGNATGNKTQRISNYGQDITQESNSKHRESFSMQSSCELQVADSEYDVYVPQTNMEVEYALTIQKQEEELERYKNEGLKLKPQISKLDADRDAIQEPVNKYSEITNQQTKEIAELKERLEGRPGNRIYKTVILFQIIIAHRMSN